MGYSLQKLAKKAGIQLGYWDIKGNWMQTENETIKAILTSLGIDSSTDEVINEEFLKLENKQKQIISGSEFIEFVENKKSQLRINLKNYEGSNADIKWQVYKEKDSKLLKEGIESSNNLETTSEYDEFKKIALLNLKTTLSIGYYRLVINILDEEYESTIIVHPPKAWSDAFANNKKLWGMACQLYSLKSETNQGVGDFTDLNNFAKEVKKLGASTIGINPLHALSVTDAESCSPYSPIDRRFINPIYIDINKLNNVKTSKKLNTLLNSSQVQSKIIALRNRETIDYKSVLKLKLDILNHSYTAFKRAGKENAYSKEFEKFCISRGQALLEYATFCSLSHHFSTSDWRMWEPEYQDFNNPKVQAHISSNKRNIDFHKFVQWQAHKQLVASSNYIKKLGFSAGIYGDLAVGATNGSCEDWANQKTLMHNVSVGAPLDDLGVQGQNWALTPPNPLKLKDSGYTFYREILSFAMSYCSILRIDHIMAISRLFIIPDGFEVINGAYLEYNSEDLLKIILCESYLNKCTVIGETLGLVTNDFLELLEKANILSYQVFLFQKWEGSNLFKRPEHYSHLALATATTHDLPTIASFYTGFDLAFRRRLGLYSDEEQMLNLENFRSIERKNLLAAMEDQDLAISNKLGKREQVQQLSLNVQKYLAKSNSLLTMVNINDLLGEFEAANIPGTTQDVYKNWSNKLSLTISELSNNNNFNEILNVMKENSRS